MTCIIEATPRRNGLRQILGRILRRGSDESIVRQVVDIVDTRTGLRSQAADRRKIYLEKGYPILKAAASWLDFATNAPAAVLSAELDEDFANMSIDDLLAAELDEDFANMSIDDLLAAALGDNSSAVDTG